MARRVALQEASTVSGEVFVPAVKALLCGTFIANMLFVRVKALRRGCGFALIGKVFTVAVQALRRGCGFALHAAPVCFGARSTQLGAATRAWACNELVIFGRLGRQTPLAT